MRRLARWFLITSTAGTLVAGAGFADRGYSSTAPLPFGTSPVTVAAGATRSGINASLHRGGVIAGQVMLKHSGLPARWAKVVAIRTPDHRVGAGTPSTEATRTGAYRIPRLMPGDYYLCAYPRDGRAPGYVPQCEGTAEPPTSASVPLVARPVHVSAGRTSTVSLALPEGGAIAGTVRSTSDRLPLTGVRVQVYLSGRLMRSAWTNAKGAYQVVGLLGAHSYRLCFNTWVDDSAPVRAVGGTTSPTGYLPRCWQQVPWWPRDTVPSAAAPVRVHGTATTANVNALLPAAGAITGSIRSSLGKHPSIVESRVSLYQGRVPVRTTLSDGYGSYRFSNLRAGPDYIVCAQGGYINASPVDGGQCWKDTPWGGGHIPDNPRPISVTIGNITRSINLVEPGVIAGDGTVSGVVTFNGKPVDHVAIRVFHDGAEMYLGGEGGPTHTGTDGRYSVSYIPAGVNYQICFDPWYYAAGWPNFPPTGYTGTCYGSRPWAGPDARVPPDARPVTVSRGRTSTTIDGRLGLGGSIAGTVTHAGHAVSRIRVVVLDHAGQIVGWGNDPATDARGRYRVTGLLPTESGYAVCFVTSAAHDTAGDVRSAGLVNQCYDNQPWQWWPPSE